MEGRSRAVVDDTGSAEPGESGESAESGDELQTPNSAADVYQKIDFGTALQGQFSSIFQKGATRDSKVAQREPKGAQRHPQ